LGSFAHVLKANKTRRRPRNWIVFDCEAFITPTAGGGQEHTLRLGCGRYRRDGHGRHIAQLADFDFGTVQEFWGQVFDFCERDRRLVMVGYNIGYDIRLVNAFAELHDRGYGQQRIYVGGKVMICQWSQDKHHIVALDAMNYFDGSLESWGQILGLPKIPVDFKRCSDSRLLDHCRRDVEILDALLLRWFDFIDCHDLGCFSPTRASQSLTAFRHRFMSKKIYIHNNPRAIDIERAAYHGGRTECFHIGSVSGGPFYKLDVNSMYPTMMHAHPVPVRLRGIASSLDVADLARLVNRYALCGLFDVSTDQPAYVVRQGPDTLYPVGNFNTHLCTPEIEYALKYNHIKRGLKVCVYDRAVIFKRYVDYFYKIRQRYKEQGNGLFVQMVKILMNSLYGKFGQRSEQWEKVPNELGDKDGEYTLFDDEKSQWLRYVVIATERWNILGRVESYSSFTAIAAHITAAARMNLWSLILRAGRSNVFYVDTDSLIVNAAGYAALSDVLDDSALGMLKLEYATQTLTIQSPKEYSTDLERKHKGIRKDAQQLSACSYRQDQWEGLRGAIAAGMTDRVRIKPVIKVLSRQYRKGIVQSSGAVTPVVMGEVS
jgi:hypothetical protein